MKIGDVLGTIAEGAAQSADRGRRRRRHQPTSLAAAKAAKAANGGGVPATPSARKAAREQNVELASRARPVARA